MNTYTTLETAAQLAADRQRETAARAEMATALAEAGADHPVRRRAAHTLISLGIRLLPATPEIRIAAQPSQPC